MVNRNRKRMRTGLPKPSSKKSANNPNRRRFIAAATLSVAGAAIGIPLFLKSRKSAAPAPVVENYDPVWAFAHRDRDDVARQHGSRIISAQELRRSYLQIGGKNPVIPGSAQFLEAIQGTAQNAEIYAQQKGITPEYELLVFEETFARPSHPVVAQSVINYGKKADAFLHSELEGIAVSDLQWTPVLPGGQYISGIDSHVLIGASSHEVESVSFVHPTRGDGHEVASRSLGADYGAYNAMEFTPDGGITRFHIFLSDNKNALYTVFSEITALTTQDATGKHALNNPSDEAFQLNEAITESLGYHLALRLVKELGAPNGTSSVQRIYEALHRHTPYRFVRRATSLLNRIGAQNALDLYREDPGKYKAELMKEPANPA